MTGHFTAGRFGLLESPEDVFLRFLAETVHPAVRNPELAKALVDSYNGHLRGRWVRTARDQNHFGQAGVWRSQPCGGLSRCIPTALRGPTGGRGIHQPTDHSHGYSISADPELAIGTAKELVETACKTVLDDLQIPFEARDDLPKLVRATAKALERPHTDIPDAAKASDSIRRLLSNLLTIADALAQLRNAYGTGHGRSAKAKVLQPRHARLDVGAAATLSTFLFETHAERTSRRVT